MDQSELGVQTVRSGVGDWLEGCEVEVGGVMGDSRGLG